MAVNPLQGFRRPYRENDPVSLSIQAEVIAIARGFALDWAPTEMIIGTNLALNIDALLDRSGKDRSMPIVWRIGKDDILADTASQDA